VPVIYTPEPKPLGYPDDTKREAVRLYLEGVNFRRIGRILSVNHQSVINWINSYHTALPEVELSVSRPEVVELDELFTFDTMHRFLRRGVGAHARGLARCH
jgi:transposase-like protein